MAATASEGSGKTRTMNMVAFNCSGKARMVEVEVNYDDGSYATCGRGQPRGQIRPNPTPIKTSTGKKDLKLYGSLNELNPYTSS